MGHLEETPLPGIGKRVEFFTDEGRRMGVVQHHGGRREVFVCEPADPDTTDVAVNLTEDDAHSLVEALAVEPVTKEAGQRTYDIEGLVFAWLDVQPDSPVVGESIGQQRIRTRTGASIVAVIRSPSPVPAPDPSLVFEPGDTLVVAGTPEGIDRVRDLLEPS